MKSTSMKLKQGLLFAALLGVPAMASAQNSENLVDNGGFESIGGKIKKTGQIDLATGWKSPTGARADLFLSDSKIPEVGAPKNVYGDEAPKEGENYAGFVAYSYGDKAPRTYVMAKLKTPLKKDVKYCVQFYVNLAEASKYSSNQIGLKFSKKEYGTDAKSSIIEDKTDILHMKNKIVNAMYGWELICGTYVAEGGEKYITIGNFTSNENTKNERNKKSEDFKGTQLGAAYYFVDDVSVRVIGDGETCDCGAEEDNSDISTTIYQKVIAVNDKMSPKQKVELQSMYFAFGKDKLTQQAMTALDLVATEMKANPSMMITLKGHSDAKEDEMAEKKPIYAEMDKKRIAAVKAYLVSKGVEESRISGDPQGNGTSNPEINEQDEDDLKMAKNRRVHIVVN